MQDACALSAGTPTALCPPCLSSVPKPVRPSQPRLQLEGVTWATAPQRPAEDRAALPWLWC